MHGEKISSDFTVDNLKYDAHSNIQSMKVQSTVMQQKKTVDNLSYSYGSNSNRLQSVSDNAGDNGQKDFTDANTVGNDYSYDVNGNLTEDKNKAVTIAYDSYTDKPNKISQTSTGDYVSYVYDASGERLKKIIKQGTTTITYTYIDGFTYRKTATATNTNPTDTLLYFAHDEGRVRRNYKNQLVYDYFIEDHLGNIRMVLTEEVDQVGYVSTFEQPKDAIEPPIFGAQRDATKELINSTFPYYIPDPDATAPANNWHSRLNANDVSRRTGSSVILKVMAGDALDISVKGYYRSSDPVPSGGSPVTDMVQSLLGALLGNQTSLVPNGKGNLVSGNSAIVNQSDIGNFINGTQNDPNNQYTNTPKAYLNYVLFDENFAAVANGYKRVNTADVQTVYSFPGVSVPVNGYVYVWISNESGMNVYFDDLSVQHTTGPIVQENTFYPYGLPIEPLSSYAAIKTANKELYQSKLLDDEMGLNLYYFDARYFDPQTGRFLSMDPKMQLASGYQGMGGNPAMFVDPDGQWVHLVIGALIGGVVNLATQALQGNIHSFGAGLKAFGIGAAMGAVTAAIGYGGFGGNAAIRAWNAGFLTNSSLFGGMATGIASSFLPSIPIGNNFSISPSFAFGSHGLSAGLNANLKVGEWSIGGGFSNLGVNSRYSYGVGYDNGRGFGISYSRNHFTAERPQITGQFGFRFDKLSLSWENDRFGFVGGFDRGRTNGMGIGYTFKDGSQAYLGSRFMTGESIPDPSGIPYGPQNPTYFESETNPPREGLFYAGYRNNKGLSISGGKDWEHGRAQVMNKMHDAIMRPIFHSHDWHFANLQSTHPTKGFFRYGNTNPFTYFY